MGGNPVCTLIYGPVQSRRHGLSLGINLGNDQKKICSWGCIYCQCGMGERRELKQSERIQDVDFILSSAATEIARYPKLYSVTFAGNSEPTTHPKFLEIVEGLQKIRGDQKWILNVLSNGSELDQPKVLQACDLIDEAWIKLDCAIDDLFKRLDRPLAHVGTVQDHVNRILKLQKPRLQSLFWNSPGMPELANWTEANRTQMLTLYQQIQPHEIHLTTVARDTAVGGLTAVNLSELEEFAKAVRGVCSAQVAFYT